MYFIYSKYSDILIFLMYLSSKLVNKSIVLHIYLLAGPDKSIARPPGTSPKSRRASLFRLYDARSGKCQKIARTVKSASIYGKKVWSKDVNKYW